MGRIYLNCQCGAKHVSNERVIGDDQNHQLSKCPECK